VAGAAVDELRDRDVGDGDEVPLVMESLAAITCVGLSSSR
jgi:hypothetical protein